MDLGGHNSVHGPFSVTCVRTKQKQAVRKMEMHALRISLLFINGFNNKNKMMSFVMQSSQALSLVHVPQYSLESLLYVMSVWERLSCEDEL